MIFRLRAKRENGVISVQAEGEARNWTLCLRNITQIAGVQGATQSGSEQGVVIAPQGGEIRITL